MRSKSKTEEIFEMFILDENTFRKQFVKLRNPLIRIFFVVKVRHWWNYDRVGHKHLSQMKKHHLQVSQQLNVFLHKMHRSLFVVVMLWHYLAIHENQYHQDLIDLIWNKEIVIINYCSMRITYEFCPQVKTVLNKCKMWFDRKREIIFSTYPLFEIINEWYAPQVI